MAPDFCPLPAGPPDDSELALMQKLLAAARIAVVGLSDDPSRPSYEVAGYLLDAGREVVPVNPNHGSVFELKCYASLEEVPGRIDLVNVFRRPEACPDVVRSAARIGAGGIWVQSGIRSPEARKLAQDAGLPYIEDRCLMVELMRVSR